MIVVVIVGILAAIAIPNYMSMQDRAKEANVKGAVHTVQLAMEDFAVRHDGLYSDAAADLLPFLPGGKLLENPYTGKATEPRFGGEATSPGQVSVKVLPDPEGRPTDYVVKGYGTDTVALTLTSRR